MSSRNDRQPWILRFCDTFLQEQSIKWMLAVGMLILLGSSLMLVTSHWDSYTPVWKLLVLVSYTGGVHLAGQICHRSMGLQRTGTGLMALTVLLIPLPFHSLRWVAPELASSLEAWGHHAGVTAILCASVAFALFASSQIFRHFLRRPEYVFTAAYVVLSVAGAVVHGLPSVAAPWVALLLWFVFAVGATRVNKHIFWLVADHRWPRVCAFFPILLLGGQFLILFASSLVPHVPVQWLGLGLVLTGIPVLLAADQQVKVLRRQNDTAETSLPWSTALPLVTGLAFAAAGVCLAATGFPRGTALVPTAGLAAAMLYVVARRTERSGFVWPMLILTTIAYQSCPVFFRDFARHLIDQTAEAVRESRLPIAFYGLTYLPLLCGLSFWSVRRQRAGDDFVAVPLRRFATGMAGLLVAASLFHPKALFPVGMAMVGLLVVQTILFRSRLAARIGIAAWVVAAAGFTTFVKSVLDVSLSDDVAAVAWVLAGAVLCVPGRWLDRRIEERLGPHTNDRTVRDCQNAGLFFLLVSAVVWSVATILQGFETTTPLAGVLLTGLLLSEAIVRGSHRIANVAMALIAGLPGILCLTFGATITFTATVIACSLFGLWIASLRLRGKLQSDVARTLAAPTGHVVMAGFLGLGVPTLLLSWGLTLLGGTTSSLIVPSVLATTWALGEAARLRHGTPACLLCAAGWIGVLGTAGSSLILMC